MVVIVGILGTQGLSRLLLQNRSEARVPAQFQAAYSALAQYAATAKRLPCPADPAVDDGAAVPATASATCTHPEGTLPWKTIGLAREEAVDPWGGKISYRVYTGNAGSLTQAGGTSMIECDTSDAGAATALAANVGRLCNPAALVTYRDTGPASFLAGKGFNVSDMGVTKTGVAYVLVSHGATGRGAYTSTGARRAMPLGDELTNTGSADPPASFVIRSFSASGTDPSSATHFDDHVSYRTIDDLVKAAGLYARDWPETASAQVRFTQSVVEAAVGHSVTPGSSVGQVTVNFTGIVAAALDSGGNPVDVTFATLGANSGIGVAGGGSALIQSGAGENIRFSVEKGNTRFGLTLVDFGRYGAAQRYWEVAEVRFYNGGAQVGLTKYAAGCRIDGGLASFDVDAGVVFDRVDITALNAFDSWSGVISGQVTAFLVGEVRTCPSSSPTCPTSLSVPGNACAYYEF